MDEETLRRIVREEIERSKPLVVVQPVYMPIQQPVHQSPSLPYYPGGPWPATCANTTI